MDDIDILNSLRLALIDQIGQERFDLWFESNVHLRLEQNQLFIESSSQVTLDFLRKNFRNQINLALQSTISNPVVVQFQFVAANENATIAKPSATKQSPALKDETLENTQESALQAHKVPSRKFAKFDTFVSGPCNNMAITAARMILNQPGQMSPLFLAGPSGSGKTHLSEAIYCEARRTRRFSRVLYLTAEQFTTFFLSALQGTGIASFRRKYRDADLLILDDVQFFAGKKATRTELIHTLDAINRRGGQIVLTSDKLPTDLGMLGPELIARFSGGLVCKLEHFDDTTKQQFLTQLAQQRQIEIDPSVIQWVSEHIAGDARALSGALNRLWASSTVAQQPISIHLAEACMADLIEQNQPTVRLIDVEKAICKSFNLDAKLLQSDCRSRKASHPRMLAMWLARKHTRAALSEICGFFKRKSHSTVISAEKKINQMSQQSNTLQLNELSMDVNQAIRQVEAELKRV